MSPGAKRNGTWIMRGVVGAILLLGAGLFGMLFGHTSLEAHPVAAVKIETMEEQVAAIGVTMIDVRLQQARIEPLLQAVQRQLDGVD